MKTRDVLYYCFTLSFLHLLITADDNDCDRAPDCLIRSGWLVKSDANRRARRRADRLFFADRVPADAQAAWRACSADTLVVASRGDRPRVGPRLLLLDRDAEAGTPPAGGRLVGLVLPSVLARRRLSELGAKYNARTSSNPSSPAAAASSRSRRRGRHSARRR